MNSSTQAAVLCIGTELTRGELVNSNAAWLAEELTVLGFEVTEHATVDDDVGRIAQTMRRLSATNEVLLSTGGLGPTTDDLTTEATALALGVGLVRDSESLARIQAFFAARGRNMSPSNEKQANFPEGAEVLANDAGTAPGFAARFGRCRIFVMPGVPREMKHIFRERVVPRLAALARKNLYQVHLRTFGMPESELGDLLSGIEDQFPGVTIGYRASFPEIEVKVLARAGNEIDARGLAERAAEAVRSRLGDIVFGGREDSLASVAAGAVRAAGMKLAVADDCTGGLLGALLGAVPEAKDDLLLHVAGAADGSLGALLGIDGALGCEGKIVSAEMAEAMAFGVLRVSGADLAVAVSGACRREGEDLGAPVGAVFIAGASLRGACVTKQLNLPGSAPERIRTASAYHALRIIQRMALCLEP